MDDTLYPVSAGLASAVLQNIKGTRVIGISDSHVVCCIGCLIANFDRSLADYMVEKLGIDKSKIADLCNLLYKNYGTTMAGLRVCMLT